MPDAVVTMRPWWVRPPYPFWALLAVPAVLDVVTALTIPGMPIYTRHSGLISCFFLILSLMITPMSLMFGPCGWILWLRARRRHIGVAAFAYAMMHLAIFIKGYPQDFWPSFGNVDFVVGWIGLAVMAVMAWTSRDASVRRMGRWWKPVQQLVYLAMPLIVFHWWIFPKHTWEVEGMMLPLVVLTLWRVFFRRRRVEPGDGIA